MRNYVASDNAQDAAASFYTVSASFSMTAYSVTTTGPIAAAGSITALSYGGSNTFILQRANGTAAAPTAIAAGNVIGLIGFSGYTGTLYSSAVNNYIGAVAAEAFTSSAQGTYIIVNVIQPTTTAIKTAARFDYNLLSVSNLTVNDTTSPVINFSAVGAAAPAFTTRSVGTKIVLLSAISSTTVDYAIGISGSTWWQSVPGNTAGYNFKWYGGTTVLASMDGTGILTTNGLVLTAGQDLAKAWTAFTPAFTATGGTAVSIGTQTGTYKLVGKTLYLRAYMIMSYTTAPSSLTLTLPINLSSQGLQILAAVVTTSGAAGGAYSNNTTTCTITPSAYTSGSAYLVGGVIEVQ